MSRNPFSDLKPLPVEHFKLYFYAAVLHVLEQTAVASGSAEAGLQHFPFLAGYDRELQSRGLKGATFKEKANWWRHAMNDWQEAAGSQLPLCKLCEHCGVQHEDLVLLFCAGLCDEDGRFGLVFDSMQAPAGIHRPTVGLLQAWWREIADVRASLQRLLVLGLVQFANPDAPYAERVVQPLSGLWEIVRGHVSDNPLPRTTYVPASVLPDLGDLILAESLRHKVEKIPALLASRTARALLVRGPQNNSRHTIIGAIAGSLGQGLLEFRAPIQAEHDRGAIATASILLNALPLLVLDLSPGESVELPQFNALDLPFAIILGRYGGVTGGAAREAISIDIDIPADRERQQHWAAGFGSWRCSEIESIGQSLRMTAGNIRRAGKLAQSYATMAGADEITLTDVGQASRGLSRHILDTLAIPLAPVGNWSHLAASEETLRALRHLESRCQNREQLHTAVGAALDRQLNPGVRALFRGPSGTGKTLAARLLASALGKDLYRIDLSAVVNKYIGETEKSLNHILSRAEELDVILLLDEGDALLTQRTGVQTSNDRYANLETNFLLQRLESFEGILFVTTNAGNRIDSAFQRRMDVIVDFRPPDAAERWTIWQMHLPEAHAVDAALLQEIAVRCRLTGGQIRNAVLHASVLALDAEGVITSDYLQSGLLREYEKLGSVCPLRSSKAGECATV